jgi:alpha/beta superfamily hydrolase
MIVTTASAQVRTKSAGAGLDAERAESPVTLLRGSHLSAHRRTVRSIALRGPAGRLEAILNDGAPSAPCAALLCHPHPLGGGTMHNKVVYHAMKALNDPAWGLSLPVLRFNFRGTGLSEGAHHGHAEADDVLAALDWLENEFNLPIVAAGFSFGAATVLRACCTANLPLNVRALVALGLPVESRDCTYDYSFLRNVALPKLFISGDRDRFAPAAQLEQIVASAADPKSLSFIHNTDHFFTGQLEPMQYTLAHWLKEQLL